jgi:hypothetical protein
MESFMRTTVLALTLIAAFAAPAFAESEKAAEEKATQETVKKAPAQSGDNWGTCGDSVEDDNGGCE